MSRWSEHDVDVMPVNPVAVAEARRHCGNQACVGAGQAMERALVAILADFLAAGWTRQRLALEGHLVLAGVDVGALHRAVETRFDTNTHADPKKVQP